MHMTLCYLYRVKRNFRERWMNFIMCTRRELKVNAGKSKVMVFERREVEVVNRRKVR